MIGRVAGVVAMAVLAAACSTGGTEPEKTFGATVPTSTTSVPTTVSASSTLPTAPSTTRPTATTTTTSTSTTTTSTTQPLVPLDPTGATIREMQQAMDEGSLTAVALTAFYLERIAAYDDSGPALNALITVNPAALDIAATLDAERAETGPRSPLHGIPIVVKDNFNTADMPTTAGSVALAEFTPTDDAAQVALLREAGAIILAKANLYEFARTTQTLSSVDGLTLHPWNPTRNVGGSSGGTAAAVTVEFAAAGLGTDTCGSIRMPSAFAGLYGLRPTVGLTSNDGIVPLAPWSDTAGPMTRSVDDLAILLDISTGGGTEYQSAAAGSGLDGVRIGVLESFISAADGQVAGAIRNVLAIAEGAGATLVPVEIPGRSNLVGDGPSVVLRAFAFALGDYLAQYPDAPVSSLAEIVDSGRYLSANRDRLLTHLSWGSLDTLEYRAAQDRREPLRAAVEAVMAANDLDAIAYPAVAAVPAPVGSHQPGNNCTTAAVAGLPALVLPAGLAADMPTGLELLGAPYSEPTLIAIAAAYERVAGPRPLPPGVGLEP